MSSPRLASSSVRRNIIRIKIKKAEKKTELMEAGAVLTSTKEELHPNSSPDMKLHQSTCCSSQVARAAPAESPTRNLEVRLLDVNVLFCSVIISLFFLFQSMKIEIAYPVSIYYGKYRVKACIFFYKYYELYYGN